MFNDQIWIMWKARNIYDDPFQNAGNIFRHNVELARYFGSTITYLKADIV